jgi:hypothetical protein
MTLIHKDELHTNFSVLPVSELVEPGQRMVTEYRTGVETAELLEANGLRDFEDRPLRFVRVTDPSTGRHYVIRVAHDCKRVYEGVGRSFGMSEQEYKNSLYIRQGDVGLMPLDATLSRQQHS